MFATKSRAVVALAAGALLLPLASHAQTHITLYDFKAAPDGRDPQGSLVFLNGALYGTTSFGGVDDSGTIFKIDLSTHIETVIHSFTGADGATPTSGLIYQGGAFYGTSFGGGAFGLGAVFKVDAGTGAETVLHSFAGGTDGQGPWGGLIYRAGAASLYGTTVYGGSHGQGTLFKLTLNSATETVLYDFTGGADGGQPSAGLINTGDALYGTTFYGGIGGYYGTLYRFDFKTNTATVLHDFTGGADGAHPTAAAIHQGDLVHDGGILYGTASTGPATGQGCAFAYMIASEHFTVLYRFQGGTDGAFPSALVQNGAALYGTTSAGGAPGVGTIFEVNARTGKEKVLYRFATNGSDGKSPDASLIDQNSTLYGTTTAGGAAGNGTVFALTP